MPYRTNAELPPAVQKHLPEHGLDIYREAFNQAFASNAGEAERDRRSHMIAWAAVMQRFEKASDGRWIVREPNEFGWLDHHG